MKCALALLAWIASAAVPAAAQTTIANPLPPPLPLAETGSDGAELALGDAQSRMTVPVSIGDSAPIAFIIDTGAERTVVSRQLAGVLGLRAGPSVRVTAMSGSAWVPTSLVPSLAVGPVPRRTVVAPALDQGDLGAHGILGVDALADHRVVIDFDRQRMSVVESRRRARSGTQAGDIVVVARSIYGQLIVTNAMWHGVEVAVIVDTGTPVSMGNRALLRAMASRAQPVSALEMTTVIGGVMRPPAYRIDQFQVGDLSFGNLTIGISDAPPFARFGLADKPAMLLGMEALRLFRRVEIDFARHTIRFSLPRGASDRSAIAAR